MFIRSKVAKGTTYYAVVETYRDGLKVRHRQIAALGTCPTIEGAVRETRRIIGRLKARRGKLERLWPIGSTVPASAARELARNGVQLALQEWRLVRLQEVAGRMNDRVAPAA